MKKQLLLFASHQFGYLTDTLKYCEHMDGRYDVTYMGWDYGKMKIIMKGIDVKYVSRAGHLLLRNYRLLKALHREVRSGRYDVVFAHYTRGISLVKLLNPRQRFIFDIRTGSTDRHAVRRGAYDLFMQLESIVFREITVISEGLAEQLGIRRYDLLPLGADALEAPQKRFSGGCMHLLYVGTLQGRNILECVKGLHQYLQHETAERTVLTIIGDSPGSELEEITAYISAHPELKDSVVCTGRLPRKELDKYFREAHAGLSFIPATPWYTRQPPTKTCEYLLSGLPVIATRTEAHMHLLEGEEMCVLINDTADDVAKAIAVIRAKLPYADAAALQQKYIRYTWRNVVNAHFIPLIQQAF